MRIIVFAALLVIVMIVVGAWSLAHGAGFPTVALRVVVTALVLQVGYFVMLMVFAYLPNPAAQRGIRRAEEEPRPPSRTVPGANDTSR